MQTKKEKSIEEEILFELRRIERNTNTVKIVMVIALIISAIAIVSTLLYPLTIPR